MAEVAVLSIWMFRCPGCDHYSRHWDQTSAIKSAEYHMRAQHDEVLTTGWEYETRGPKRVPWAFRVVNTPPPADADPSWTEILGHIRPSNG